MATKKKPVEKEEAIIDDPFKAHHYEEWECKITPGEGGPKFEKLICRRKRVLITDDQAEILNEGRLHGGNTLALLYFKAEVAEQE
jgi:hypothetical protein